MKKAYLEHIEEPDSDEEVNTLPPRKHGQPCLLSDLEKQQQFVKNTRSDNSLCSSGSSSWYFDVV